MELPDFSTMTEAELEAYIQQRKSDELLLRTKVDPRRLRRTKMADPEDRAKQELRVLAKVAGRSKRQAELATARDAAGALAYSEGVAQYCRERDLAELPPDLASELGYIWTWHNTPQLERDKLEQV